MPDLPVIHAYLGAVFERRGQVREALEEYRRALRAPSASSGPTGARPAEPSARAGPIDVRHAVAGTASGPSVPTVVSRRGGGRGSPPPSISSSHRFCPLSPSAWGRPAAIPCCGRCWLGLERIAVPWAADECGLPFSARSSGGGNGGGGERRPRSLRGVPPAPPRLCVRAGGRPLRRPCARGVARVQVRRPAGARGAAGRSRRRAWLRPPAPGAGRHRPRAAAPAARAGARLQPVLLPRAAEWGGMAGDRPRGRAHPAHRHRAPDRARCRGPPAQC